jgi:ribosomal protein S18 acetylase RimI-like enzyme
MDVASLGFRTDLAVLALGGSAIEHRGRHVVVRTPANPTYWWGNFLLFADPVEPREILERLALFATEFPGTEHVAWGIDSVDGTLGDEDELLRAGFEVSRDTVLSASALVPPRREIDAKIRPLQRDDEWRQALELHVACVARDDEHITDEFLTAQVAAYRALSESADATWYGAFEGEHLLSWLGIVADGTGLARFQAVETHPDARRRGLASALVHHAGRAALGNGATTLVIVADPGYHAIGIYRALGFAEAETQVQLTRPPGVRGG